MWRTLTLAGLVLTVSLSDGSAAVVSPQAAAGNGGCCQSNGIGRMGLRPLSMRLETGMARRSPPLGGLGSAPAARLLLSAAPARSGRSFPHLIFAPAYSTSFAVRASPINCAGRS
jgi:hypothetical protein